MLQLLVKRTKFFSDGKDRSLTVGAGGDIQTVPDWVKRTGAYKLGIQDGSILEVTVTSPPVASTPPKRQPSPTGLGLNPVHDTSAFPPLTPAPQPQATPALDATAQPQAPPRQPRRRGAQPQNSN